MKSWSIFIYVTAPGVTFLSGSKMRITPFTKVAEALCSLLDSFLIDALAGFY